MESQHGYLHGVPLVPPDIPSIGDWQPLARGGFATVWRARQRTLDRPVAVKVDDRTLDTEVERRRFLGEAKAAGNLSGHPGIVTVHDAGILPDGRPFLVMKLCSGGSLTSWLRPETRQSPERICSVGARIADALAVAHAQGMLHRDVKPANILIDSYGNPGLADFGLAAPEPGSDAGMTVAYAPPEVILGESPSAAGDVYQLAATLYALLAGRPPSESKGTPSSLADRLARLKDPPEPVPDVDEDLMRVVLDGLAFSPADRPTAAQFRDRLAAITAAHEDANREGSSGMWRRRRVAQVVVTLVAATVVSLLVVMLGGSSVYLYEIDRSVTANIKREIDLPPEETAGVKRPVKAPEADQTLDYLLIGTDGGNPQLDDEGRSDSIMLIHLNEARDQAYVISVPRNTLVSIPGEDGEQRINAAYALGEAPLVVRTLEKLTGTRIDHVAMIDFQGFVALTQDLDGITVHNRTPFSSNGYNYPAGNIPLKGDAALWYVRERHALPRGEEDRAENQRNVIKAILAKGLSPAVVADPFQFTNFLGNAAKRIKVDKSLTNAELRATATSLRMKPENITLISVPLETKVRTINRQRVYRVDQGKLAELTEAMRKDTMAEYVKNNPS
jgi:LCP family protein required for cell wall assembly